MDRSSSSQSKLYTLEFASASDHLNLRTGESFVESDTVQTSYLLLELPPELLDPIQQRLTCKPGDSVKSDFTLELCGNDDEEAVLTTSDQTYALRTVENSNSVMICGVAPNLNEDEKLAVKVMKVVHETIEATNVTDFPGNRLDRIKQLLQSHLYMGESHEGKRSNTIAESDLPPVSFASLCHDIRASGAEIQKRLTQVLVGLLNALDELGVGPHEDCALGPLLEILMARRDINQSVALQILSRYTSAPLTVTSPFDSFDQHQTIRFQTQKIINLIGLSILLSIKPAKVDPSNPKDSRYIQSIKLSSFLAAWRTQVGDQRAHFCVLDQLQSHSILSYDGNSLIVVPLDKLSSDPKTRMSQLFEIRPKWKPDELERFVIPITGGGKKKKLDELILKYCRKIKENEAAQPNLGSKPIQTKGKQTSETIWLTARNKW
ncbi:hypothetical protein O181_022647 [Austropuccinia psidii MF-1]|uniref:Sister chromatid cohesion protein DCC1 n=1 Tax=Austropuccinia psidii MF-1 TaxID=1389203 RepID=A0A9Q3CFW2_9BASI|nr:hypothetical protein [Austropuccinia psidii MF-1]